MRLKREKENLAKESQYGFSHLDANKSMESRGIERYSEDEIEKREYK